MANVFVGFYYDKEKEQELLSVTRRGISAAANQYQGGFLDGLPGEVQIISTLSIGTYPKLSKRLVFKRERKQCDQGQVVYLPFVNLPFVKNGMFKSGLYKELRKIIKADTETTIYVYSLNVVFEKVLARLKRKYGNTVRYCLIIPDLPGKYGIVRKGIKGIKDRLEIRPKMNLAAAADSYVFLTEAMKELFPERPYAVIEGFLPAESFDYTNKRIPKTILYTGSLSSKFGIKTLLDAFAMIEDQEYRLWICGSGEMEQEIIKKAQKDLRIEFKGFVSKKQIAELQSRCDVLINPRPDADDFTKYSFPSKTMEYLLSGSKVLMYKLAGIGEEYYRFIREIESSDPQVMAEAIQEACNDKKHYDARWQEQIQWIKNHKNSEKQVEKLLMR